MSLEEKAPLASNDKNGNGGTLSEKLLDSSTSFNPIL